MTNLRIVRCSRVIVWPLLLFVVFTVSKAAGRIEADGYRDERIRSVEVLLDPRLISEFQKPVSESLPRYWTDYSYRNSQAYTDIVRASTDGNLKLVWRDQNETVFMISNGSGKNSDVVYRIANDHIVGTFFRRPNSVQ